MKQKITGLLTLLTVLIFSSCLVVDNPHSALAPGKWRAILKLDPRPISPNPKGEPLPEKLNFQFEEVTEGELPFNFEVKYVTPDSFVIELINGEERIVVDDISFGRDIRTAKDTLRVEFPVFDSYITALYEEDVIEGTWVVNYREEYRIPFVAKYGEGHRFTTLRKEPVMDISGTWDVQFEIEGDNPYPAVAELQQQGQTLTGTFRTETGDYRFLAGTVQANKLYLSCFDGAHAFLFEGKINDDGSLIGSFQSGRHYKTLWSGVRNPDATLPDPHELTSALSNEPFELTFETPEGTTVDLSDPNYAGKIKIVQVLGTWCPNCLDETNFLLSYLQEHPSEQLEVMGLAFERYREKDKAMGSIARYRKKLDIPYPIGWGGYYDKKEASERLPQLNEIISYPTLIFLDGNNRVRRIHTGFNGPATSEYEDFTVQFHEFVQALLAEQK
jgi:thiol-disulfide isomerase/thioredoxin